MERQQKALTLNPWAKSFVKSERMFLYTEEFVIIYPSGKRKVINSVDVYDTPISQEESGKTVRDRTGRLRKLNKYTFPDGRVYFEAVQDCKDGWGFLILVDQDAKIVPQSLWCSRSGCGKPASIVTDIVRPRCLMHELIKSRKEQSPSKK